MLLHFLLSYFHRDFHICQLTGGLCHGAESLGDIAVLSYHHPHVAFSYLQSESDCVLADLLGDLDFIGILDYGSYHILEKTNKIYHILRPHSASL